MDGYKVVFYEEHGVCPVMEFLRSLPSKKVKEKVNARILLLGEKGFRMPFEYNKNLKGYPLWELKIPYGTNTYRVLYFFHGSLVVLLHGFAKKTDETPKSHIDLALRRMERWKGIRNL
jgi:phage-related protein